MTVRVIGTEVRDMFGSIAPRYDLANSILSLGIHHSWRRALLRMVPENKKLLVLDVCTGTGDLIPLLKTRFGAAIGLDFCAPMLAIARSKQAQESPRLNLVQGDALRLPFGDGTFDVVTVAFGVRNFERLEEGLSELKRVLRQEGALLVLEFGQPPGMIWGAMYKFYSRFILPTLGAFCTGNTEAYRYLPKTASHFPCGEQFTEDLRKSGFKKVEYRALTGGIAYAYCARIE